MDQISPPMRIVLAVAVVFLAAYMLVLKPKDDTATPVAATPAATPATASATDGNKANTSLGKAVESARGASDAVENKQNSEAAATGDDQTAHSGASTPSTTASTPSTATTKPSAAATTAPSTAGAKPVDASLAGLPKWLQHSLDKKVVAILFVNGKAADDRRTREALKHAHTFNGRVVKRAVPISRITRFRSVAEGVDVSQSPTLMVIDRNRVARALVGYSSVTAINQAIIDSLLAHDVPADHVKFLQTVRSECTQLFHAQIIGPSAGETVAGVKKDFDHAITVNASSLGTLRNAPAPRAYRPLKHTVNSFLASQLSIYRTIKDVAFGGKSVDDVKVRSLLRRNDKLQDRTSLELAAVGINACT